MATKIKLNKGDSVWFAAGTKPFKVRVANDRFAICTQPYNFKPKTVIYTIIDFERNVRGLYLEFTLTIPMKNVKQP